MQKATKNFPSHFKKCSNCGYVWKARAELLADPAIEVIGYQINIISLFDGLFLFNHNCRGTISLKVKVFKDLYDGEIYPELKINQENCPGYCSIKNSFQKCTNACEGAFVREILHTVKNWPKNDAVPPAHRNEESGVNSK